MKAWPKVALGELCSPAKRYTTPAPSEIYRQLGVRLWGEGAYEREPINGAETKYANFNRIEANDLVVNKIWARNGAVAIATFQQANTYVSTEFPTYTLDSERIEHGWMRHITKWQGFWTACDGKARGTSGKNRITPEQFLSIEIPLPPLPEQQSLVARLDALAEKTRRVEEHLDASERDSLRLLVTMATRRDLTDEQRISLGWRACTVADIAKLAVAPETVSPDRLYPNVGILSYAKGLFGKQPIDGAITNAKTLYRIREGQFIYSRLFAFEGAYALVPSDFDGYYVSNEFPTFDINPDLASVKFLTVLFLTETDWQELRASTKGMGDRRLRIKPEHILARPIWLPPRHDVSLVERLFDQYYHLKARHTAIRQANAALLPAILERIFTSGAPTHA
jgi:type I restriction enzyme S subunit